jgi:TnpA family transposase
MDGVYRAGSIGFSVTELLNFRLLHRLRNIGSIRVDGEGESRGGGHLQALVGEGELTDEVVQAPVGSE